MNTAYCGAAGVCEAKQADGQPCTINGTYPECLGHCSTSGVCATDTGFVNADVRSTYDIT